MGCSTKNNSDQAELKVELDKMQLGQSRIWAESQGIYGDLQKTLRKDPVFLSKSTENQANSVFTTRLSSFFQSSRKRYPTPRTVSIASALGPIFLRRARMWTSMVRSRTRVSSPNAESISSVRSNARPG